MDKARDLLIQYDEGLITVEEAICRLAKLANLNEIPATTAIGFICQIANDEVKRKEGHNGDLRFTSDNP